MRVELSLQMKPKPAEPKPVPKPNPPEQESEPKPEPQAKKEIPASVFFSFPDVSPIEHTHWEAPPPAPRTYRALDAVRGERDAMLTRLQYPPHQKNAH